MTFTESATENNCPALFAATIVMRNIRGLDSRKGGVRMKMWGKSPRRRQVIAGAGKPCMLKCHVYRRLRTARPMPEGRQLDRCSNAAAR
jgi:hypothetical protein